MCSKTGGGKSKTGGGGGGEAQMEKIPIIQTFFCLAPNLLSLLKLDGFLGWL